MKFLPATAAIVIACVATLSGTAGPALAQSQPDSGPCQRELQPGDMHEFSCPLKAYAAAQKFHFVARVSGGHDDSSSLLVVRHGGQDVACETGSKVGSEGEDGDITLDCRFTLPATALKSPSKLAVSLKASHVFFENHSLKAE
ncbi:MAG: hypothetical protein IIA02_08910 [Proteobacteria bacterium]|uniref:hypothetical protein n=1 Tax=Aquabacterium sp. TaxID=1872578 RepID=UPI0035C6B70D|nr:hypothetical protein [Pseudomonadota bacterium]